MDYDEYMELEPGEILGHLNLNPEDVALCALLEKMVEEIESLKVSVRRLQKGKG